MHTRDVKQGGVDIFVYQQFDSMKTKNSGILYYDIFSCSHREKKKKKRNKGQGRSAGPEQKLSTNPWLNPIYVDHNKT